jgi:hypothetical protein
MQLVPRYVTANLDLEDEHGRPITAQEAFKDKVVGLYFSAGHCPGCVKFSPTLSGLTESHAGDLCTVGLYKCGVERTPDLSGVYRRRIASADSASHSLLRTKTQAVHVVNEVAPQLESALLSTLETTQSEKLVSELAFEWVNLRALQRGVGERGQGRAERSGAFASWN